MAWRSLDFRLFQAGELGDAPVLHDLVAAAVDARDEHVLETFVVSRPRSSA
jgi:hypothetical protein